MGWTCSLDAKIWNATALSWEKVLGEGPLGRASNGKGKERQYPLDRKLCRLHIPFGRGGGKSKIPVLYVLHRVQCRSD